MKAAAEASIAAYKRSPNSSYSLLRSPLVDCICAYFTGSDSGSSPFLPTSFPAARQDNVISNVVYNCHLPKVMLLKDTLLNLHLLQNGLA